MKLSDAKVRNNPQDFQKNADLSKRVSSFSDQRRAEIVYLNIDRLVPYRRQARRIFDEAELELMAQTIREHGVRQPLTVLRQAESDQPFFEVVSGERRLKAAKLAGFEKIPCIIIQDEGKAEEISLIENIQRQDLHPLELAQSLKMLVERGGRGTQADLHKKIGLSPSQISELLKLTELSPKVQEIILEKNFKGRENLRKLFQFKDDLEQINFIYSLTEPTQPSSKTRSLTARSLLRISLSDGGLKIQKSGLRNLHESERLLVKEALSQLLGELSGD